MTDSITGTGVALVTPFNTDTSIDTDALSRITEHVISGGVEYIVALGTTGESATLTHDEKKVVVNTILETTRKRVPVVMGIGSNDTANIINTLKSTRFDGISGILSVAPYYNKPSQKGLYAHFAAVANNTSLPVILYNVPGRTASNLAPETVLQLAKDFKNMVAVKEASGNLAQVMQIIKNRPKGFKVLSGDDALTLPLIFLGGDGVISVIANSHPRIFSDMVRAALTKQCDKANELHYRVLDYISALFEEGSPTGIKTALSQMGLCHDTVRLPLVSASEELKKKIKSLTLNL